MRTTRKVLTISLLVIAGAVLAGVLWHSLARRPITLTGAVIRRDPDAARQAPIADVEVTSAAGLSLQSARTDSEGYFRLTLLPQVRTGQPVTLRFRRADYEPLVVTQPAGRTLFVARMAPVPPAVGVAVAGPTVKISNLTIRYTFRTSITESVGSAVRTFEAVNLGNVRCEGAPACSPDGRWRAAVASVTLDAGEGNEFRRPRVSCIAGPCPFTRIEAVSISQGGRTIRVTARTWSDTATFLLQTEVVRTMYEEVVRRVHPVVFGNALDFTLPADAEGPSIEAEVDGSSVVYPLGPGLCLTWAECRVRSDQDQTRLYRCELKPGFQFR